MQQVNLYLTEFRPKQDWLTFNLSVAYVAVFLVGMLAYQLIVWRAERHWSERVAVAESEAQTLTQQVEKLKSKPDSQSREAYQQKVNELRATIANREAIAQVIGGQAFGNREGFSQYLHAISTNWLQGIALNEFGLAHGGQYVTLTGETSHAELVPLFIGRLREHEAFSDASFGLLSLEGSGKGSILFTTEGETEKAEGRRGEMDRPLGANR